MSTAPTKAHIPAPNFIEERVRSDLADGGGLVTRFPPEPNGYLHIGHAKSICLNFGLATAFGGACNLRFDDTNPEKESAEYIDAIKQDVAWLGFNWDAECYASDYFNQLYQWAEQLVTQGDAYVDSLPADKMREYRGSLTQPGRPSPDRDRPAAESLALLQRMKAGEFAAGSYVLRAKIDMTHPNINMRDPVLYRIRNAAHPRTGSTWHIYPSYDFAHGQSDAIEGVTHSLCTLEFQDHRPLYEWLLQHLPVPCKPQQIEFSRLQLEHTITSKRGLSQLVTDGIVEGWDDPRMPTISGMRRRGYPAAAIRDFCTRTGVTKKFNTIAMSLLETCVRRELEHTAPRAMAVRDPILVQIKNWPQDELLELDIPWHTNNKPSAQIGSRKVNFGNRIWIDGADFMLDPPAKYHRLSPGCAVRLKYAFIIDCEEVITDASGKVTELICSYDPATRSGQDASGRRVRGAIQWVPADAIQITARNYDRLFSDSAATTHNPDSLSYQDLLAEPALASMPIGQSMQCERIGFYRKDETSDGDTIILNRTLSLRDSWQKIQTKS